MTHAVVWEQHAMAEFRRLRAIDPVGAKATAAAVRALADEPRPEAASALGTSGYYRLHIGNWRVLYRPDGDTVTVYVLKVGRSN
ncbi:type II toxin-antitoxin system RelE family toxin [Streptomyces sp. NPDC054950]|uniref:Type II toxin-antitoxin system RelE/ParE family toxin n=1 Tax=Streptomyces asoensis TaxID=249586 RepID=A0A6M4WSZ3_9ACTN|nr:MULTISPECIES: type II toxin-antitoxin system RelE/ParE family toxin [Streptomyces]KPI24009.1 plasmid stabilization system [Actinobacteria bacterium OV320]QJT02475.1 type II toxin-antitoxin system RelE/ParE family toxin [Streptomyces asoensis]